LKKHISWNSWTCFHVIAVYLKSLFEWSWPC
jgi:hypothetical protein